MGINIIIKPVLKYGLFIRKKQLSANSSFCRKNGLIILAAWVQGCTTFSWSDIYSLSQILILCTVGQILS